MRGFFLVLVPVAVAVAGCDPWEECDEIKVCGGKTLYACGIYDQCRFKSSDGHSWSCKGTDCETAGTEAADWCLGQGLAGSDAGLRDAGSPVTDSGGTADWTGARQPWMSDQIAITELMIHPRVVATEVGQWFEVFNLSPREAFDLSGCQIRNNKNTHTIAGPLIIPPRAFRTAAVFASGGGFVPDYTYAGITFADALSDEVSIWCGSNLIDRFAYPSSLASTLYGNALSVDPSHYGGSAQDRTDYCLATTPYSSTATADGITYDYGTPGAANPPCY